VIAPAGLRPGSGIFVRLVKVGVNPAFAVLFLRSQNLPHQGGLACLVRCARILAWFPTGAARRLFCITHDRILLHDQGRWPRTRPDLSFVRQAGRRQPVLLIGIYHAPG
jgi:hypothetical protein